MSSFLNANHCVNGSPETKLGVRVPGRFLDRLLQVLRRGSELCHWVFFLLVPTANAQTCLRMTLVNLALLGEVKDTRSCVVPNLPVLMRYDKMQLAQNGAFRMHE